MSYEDHNQLYLEHWQIDLNKAESKIRLCLGLNKDGFVKVLVEDNVHPDNIVQLLRETANQIIKNQREIKQEAKKHHRLTVIK